MSKFSIVTVSAVLAVCLGLTACGTTPHANVNLTRADAVNGDGSWLVTHFPGLPAIGDRPAVAADNWGPDQVHQLQYLDGQCHAQLDKYIPSMADDIGRIAFPMGWKTGLGAALGGGFAVVNKLTGVGFWDYLKQVGFASAGSAFGSGEASAEDRHNLAVKYVQYACMQGFVARAQQKGELKGVGTIPWAGAGYALPQKAPVGDEVIKNSSSSSSTSDDTGTTQPVPMIP